MDKIPVVDGLGNKVGDFVPNGNGCGSGVFGAISLLLFSWVHMFTDISERPKAWSDATNESMKKYWALGLVLLLDLGLFLLSSVVVGLVWILNLSETLNVLGLFGVIIMYASGLLGSILFLIFVILFFNDVSKVK